MYMWVIFPFTKVFYYSTFLEHEATPFFILMNRLEQTGGHLWRE